MRWNVAPIAVFVLALAGCGPKEEENKDPFPKITKLEKIDTKVGTGLTAEKGDNVWMKYKGTFKNGKQFDSNMESGLYNVKLGESAVIDGWHQGIEGMKEGGKRTIKVPSALAYGPQGSSSIPPNTDLIFDLELVKVLKVADENTIAIKTLKPGAGRAAKSGDTVTIEFEGKTLEGKIIDSSKKKDGKPATFKIGNDELYVRGLEDGIIGMKIGETRRIELPPTLGMPVGLGEVQAPTVQTFEVTLVKIK